VIGVLRWVTPSLEVLDLKDLNQSPVESMTIVFCVRAEKEGEVRRMEGGDGTLILIRSFLNMSAYLEHGGRHLR